MEDEAATLKKEGNDKFAAKEFVAAIDAYSRSLEVNPKQHLCYSNRCAAYLQLGQKADKDKDKAKATDFYQKAMDDATKCVELETSFAKGYRRAFEAHKGLKTYDEGITLLQKALTLVAEVERDGLEKLLKEVPKCKFSDALSGSWHGTVNEVLGGYDQEMEFLDETSVRVEVLGRSIIGKYWLDVEHDPFHLNIQVPHAEIPPGMPPPPPVPYIARIDEVGLHLCCPYLKMDRPKEFVGPGYVLMKGGSMAQVDNSEVASLSHKEKCQRCAQELLKVMPSRKLEEVSATDSEDAAGEKLMSQVRFESSMYSVCKLFGEDIVKEVLAATKGTIPEELKSIQEITELTEKLRMCGILEEDAAPAIPKEPIKSVDAASAKVEGPKLDQAQRATPPTPSSETASNTRPASSVESSSFSCSTAVVLSAAAATAAVGFMLWSKRRA